MADVGPLSGEFMLRPDRGSIKQLLNCGSELVAIGEIDEVKVVNYTDLYRRRVYEKHFGEILSHNHDARGSPILGYVFSIEEARSQYLLNTDCDMLLYQDRLFNWIDSGIRLLQKNPEILTVMPRPGPPTEDGMLFQPVAYEHDRTGFFRFELFSSRVFLIDVNRFKAILPLKIERVPAESCESENHLPSTLANWEAMVTSRMIKTGHARADLDSKAAWTLHPIDRGVRFNRALPSILKKIAHGWYPPDQAGHYDLILDSWA